MFEGEIKSILIEPIVFYDWMMKMPTAPENFTFSPEKRRWSLKEGATPKVTAVAQPQVASKRQTFAKELVLRDLDSET